MSKHIIAPAQHANIQRLQQWLKNSHRHLNVEKWLKKVERNLHLEINYPQ